MLFWEVEKKINKFKSDKPSSPTNWNFSTPMSPTDPFVPHFHLNVNSYRNVLRKPKFNKQIFCEFNGSEEHFVTEIIN